METQKRGPFALTVYSIAALPDAADFPFALIGLSDGTGHKHVAISDGMAWYYMDGSAV
ncbi:MAG: hypothetical protein JNM81_13715 [Rhodospirillaceae bacterium]|nr:hypothetical protein [Rhodospirillaceae bacterium]